MEDMIRALKESLVDWTDVHRGSDTTAHFTSGWHMWPEYWNNSTLDWQEGFRAREKYEEMKSRESDR